LDIAESNDGHAGSDAAMLADTVRVEAFSDGVFAIVITLLVIDLRVPDVPPGGLRSGIVEQWPAYLAYVTSFLAVGVVWLNHHAMFRRIRLVDRTLHWANLAILFTTALLPFPTAVVSHAIRAGNRADGRTAISLYALVGALMCASWVAFFQYLARHPRLVEAEVDHDFFGRQRLRFAIGSALYIGAGVLGSLLATPVALAIFLLVPILYGVTSHRLDELPAVVRRRTPRRRLGARTSGR
jgi:uncharacterized membrane protein